MKTRSVILIWLAAAALLGVTGARAESFPLPPAGESVIGEIHVIETHQADTLSDIARAHHVGYDQIVQANPAVDPWLPGEGTRVVVPTQHVLPDTPRTGLVLNLPEMRIYYYPPKQRGQVPVVMTFPVSVGRLDWSTPLGLTRIAAKVTNPEWRPPASIKAEHADEGETLPDVFPPGPDNPLGQYALRLAREGYLIHGTNRPYGIGMRVTHGCIRLYPEDIEWLFREVPVGTPVRIVNQPNKVGWHDGKLYLESHPPLEENRPQDGNRLTPAIQTVVAGTRAQPARIDWDQIVRVATETQGLPVAISY
ncbi:MAG: L,D-transpeptidase family protein [Pseudomonadota bacterium]